jgi:UDP-N-acetyl-D-mannosaminuronate dehydrogenase
MKIGVIGCGNVGFNTLKSFSTKGYEVLGFDVSENVKDLITSSLGEDCLASKFSDLASCNVVFECIPTEPLNSSGECDLSILEEVVLKFSGFCTTQHLSSWNCSQICEGF